MSTPDRKKHKKDDAVIGDIKASHKEIKNSDYEKELAVSPTHLVQR